MKSKLILSFFAIFLTISPVLAENLQKSSNNNVKAAFEVILLGAGCQAGMTILRSILKNSGDVNSYLKLDAKPARRIQKKLNNSVAMIEKELPLYREIVNSAEIMPGNLLALNEKDTYSRTINMLRQVGNGAAQNNKFSDFLDSLFKESEICMTKFEEYKKKVKLPPRDKQE